MRTLELSEYGVMEMDDAQMVEIDGGGFWEDAWKVTMAVTLGAVGLLAIILLLTAMGVDGDGGSGEGPAQGPNYL